MNKERSKRGDVPAGSSVVESAPGPGGYGGAGAAVGRLPAWDPAALSVMIGKIKAYEVSEPKEWWHTCIGLGGDVCTD
jgi:hypothetical protein